MFQIRIFILVGMVHCLIQASCWADSDVSKVVPVFTLESPSYPLRVVSRDFRINQQILEMAEGTVDSFIKILGLEEAPFERCVLRWRPLSTAMESIQEPVPFSFPREIRKDKGKTSLTIYIDGPLAGGQVSIRRSLIIGLLQGVSWQGEGEISLAVLPEPPVWLVEGILWEMLRFRDEAWREVVMKAARTETTPSLEEIQNWQQLAFLEFERAWQQAFSFTLFRHAFKTPAEKKALRLWLREFRVPSPRAFWAKGSATENWWREVVAEPLPDRLPILSWASTVATLNQLRSRSLSLIRKGETSSDRILVKLEELPEAYLPEQKDEVAEWMRELGLLSSKAHFAWRSIIAGYVQILDSWARGEAGTESHMQLLDSLQQGEKDVVSRYARASEMLDWAVVNLDFGVQQDRFTGYARLVRELEEERRRLRREFGLKNKDEAIYE